MPLRSRAARRLSVRHAGRNRRKEISHVLPPVRSYPANNFAGGATLIIFGDPGARGVPLPYQGDAPLILRGECIGIPVECIDPAQVAVIR